MDVQKQVDAFMELPKAERRAKYNSLSSAVKLRVRKATEARRGIARREDGGILVLKKEEYVDQALRLQEKVNDLPKRLENAKLRLVELKRLTREHYGDEALAELETALEDAFAPNQA